MLIRFPGFVVATGVLADNYKTFAQMEAMEQDAAQKPPYNETQAPSRSLALFTGLCVLVNKRESEVAAKYMAEISEAMDKTQEHATSGQYLEQFSEALTNVRVLNTCLEKFVEMVDNKTIRGEGPDDIQDVVQALYFAMLRVATDTIQSDVKNGECASAMEQLAEVMDGLLNLVWTRRGEVFFPFRVLSVMVHESHLNASRLRSRAWYPQYLRGTRRVQQASSKMSIDHIEITERFGRLIPKDIFVKEVFDELSTAAMDLDADYKPIQTNKQTRKARQRKAKREKERDSQGNRKRDGSNSSKRRKTSESGDFEETDDENATTSRQLGELPGRISNLRFQPNPTQLGSVDSSDAEETPITSRKYADVQVELDSLGRCFPPTPQRAVYFQVAKITCDVRKCTKRQKKGS
mgnify:CR=1 FL=1